MPLANLNKFIYLSSDLTADLFYPLLVCVNLLVILKIFYFFQKRLLLCSNLFVFRSLHQLSTHHLLGFRSLRNKMNKIAFCYLGCLREPQKSGKYCHSKSDSAYLLLLFIIIYLLILFLTY